jgi:polysaccharide biosynthesis protein PelD
VHIRETSAAVWRRWIETLLMAALALALFQSYGAVQSANNSIAAGWLVLLPVLAGAHHGMLYGLLSAGMVCAVGLVAAALHLPALGALGSQITEGWGAVYASVGMIAGYFRDMLERRYRELEASASQRARELSALERAYQCLQSSHAQLEAKFRTKPHSLQSVLDDVALRMHELRSSEALAELALEVVASRTRVQAASLYLLGPGDSSQQLLSPPLARLSGYASPVNRARELPTHPLVQRALRTGSLVSIVDAAARALTADDVLVVVPLQSSSAQLRLLCVVHQLAFEGFRVEELRELHILLARLIDLMQQRLDGTAQRSPQRASRAPAADSGRVTARHQLS